ncbi:MAG: HPP family protein [Halobacteriaceae archaeon]
MSLTVPQPTTLLARAWHRVRRRIHRFRRWVETTSNLLHLTVLVFVPLLIGIVTLLSNAVSAVSFLVYPPLASGTYTLFADPEGRYSSPGKFVGGMTTGAIAGWAAITISTQVLGNGATAVGEVHAGGAALAILLTGIVTWILDFEEPTAFSTALLVLTTGTAQIYYVVGVALSSGLVAVAFTVWREEFYEQRARYLYGATHSDDQVLVPMRGETAGEAAAFGARLAAAHDGGSLVLLDVVDDAAVAAAERELLAGGKTDDVEEAHEVAEAQTAVEAVSDLENRAAAIEAEYDIPTDVVVAAGDGQDAGVVLDAAADTNSDLIVTPYETDGDGLAPFLEDLLRGRRDVVILRSVNGTREWTDSMVAIARASDVAHAMIDFAQRLAGQLGTVAVCSCIDTEDERREAESTLADLAETTEARCETRVSRSSFEAFLEQNSTNYDVVFMGASTDRSAASRFLSPPTFEQIGDLQTDVAIVHRT